MIGIETEALLSLWAYTTVVCFFFYKLNERTIKEWREEHKNQMNEWREEHKNQMEKMDAKIDEIRKESKEDQKHMDAKWERIFTLLAEKK